MSMEQNGDWLRTINNNKVQLAEQHRKTFSFLTMAAISIVVLSVMIATNHDVYAPTLTVMLVVSVFTVIGCLLYYVKFGRIEWVANIIMAIIFCLCVAVIYTGGKEATGLYWPMLYPVVAYVSLGVRKASIVVCGLYISAILLLFGPDIGQVNYSDVESTRFLASFSLVFLFSFISEFFRYKSHKKIADLALVEKQDALTDPLTGLANRRYIFDHILPSLDKNPASYLPLSILLIDLDNFKSLNDTYGHDVGDKALVAFTSLLSKELRGEDIKARYGGEEFIVLLSKSTSSQASVVANKIRKAVANMPVAYDIGKTLNITCSIGIADISHSSQFDKALKKADENLYKAKAAGRNKVISAESVQG